jgi:DNA-directed RNA polymerase
LGKLNPDGLWWQGLEDPLQGLATCFELHEALQNPGTFLSHLPIHMDGSCNGLQHYGALGRDKAGGAAVNLVPHERPQDVYNGVLERVKERMAAHQDSLEPLEQQLSLLLDGKITRKVIKQTVMTSVYGVTLLGAKHQVLNRLRELDTIKWPDADKEFIMGKAAMYIAKLALDSLGDLFSSAEQIMHWLRQVARLVTTEEQQPVTWVTPLGLPVLQPYVRKHEYQVATHNYRLTIANNSDLMPVSATKQKSALPPNFVHSLDATHMLMTTTDCARRGLHFAAVHDSFWTHAGNVDEMNESLREQFVSLYSEPILEDFREFLVMRFPAVNFPPLPKCGTLDIKQVLKSNYFFA